MKTGTLNGNEFKVRTTHEGPKVNAAMPEDVIVAPGDFEKSRRISLN